MMRASQKQVTTSPHECSQAQVAIGLDRVRISCEVNLNSHCQLCARFYRPVSGIEIFFLDFQKKSPSRPHSASVCCVGGGLKSERHRYSNQALNLAHN